MPSTNEQLKVIEADFSGNDVVVVRAMPGTGKTYTCVEKAKEIQRKDPRKNILYLAFGRDVAEEAMKKFPVNTDCRTCHSLAYRAVGYEYKHKLQKNLRKTTIKDVVMEYLRERNNDYIRMKATGTADDRLFADAALDAKQRCWSRENKQFRWKLAHIVKDALDSFLYGGNDKVTEDDVDALLLQRVLDREAAEKVVVELTQHLYDRMADVSDEEVPALHDVYLKEYARSRPNLADDYDVIMVDEAQDLNGAIHSVLKYTKGACIIYVGDPHQQIYAWRGSVDAMDEVPATVDLSLTGSFRFGPAVADVATSILRAWKGETRTLEGLGTQSKIVTYDGPASLPTGTTVLTRTNAYMFTLMHAMALAGKPARIAGEYPVEQAQLIMDVLAIRDERFKDVRTDYLKVFDSYDDLEVYADCAMDFNVQSACGMVERYKDTVMPMLMQVRELHDASAGVDGAYLFCTGHKAKGREWPCVALANDFKNIFYNAIRRKYERHGRTADLEDASKRGAILPETIGNKEEANLIYVAVTRAQEHLLLTPELLQFLDKHFKGDRWKPNIFPNSQWNSNRVPESPHE